MSRSLGPVLGVLCVAMIVAGCGNDEAPFVDELGRCADFDPLRQPFWGDTHIHTDLSFDANMQGTRTTQADAYAFSRGTPIGLQPYDADGNPTRMAQIDRPLDFVMLSDHAEFLGTLEVCNNPASPGYNEQQCGSYRAAMEFSADPAEVTFVFVEINGLTTFPPEDAHYPALCGPGDAYCLDAGMDVWGGVLTEAEAAYDRSNSCSFTTFPGYEWSGGPGAKNLHRNIMFKNEIVTDLPYSYFDEPYAEGLWARLNEECIDADSGCDVLTIAHNSNLSDGLYFENKMGDGQPFTAEYAETRNAIEPVIEIYQHKGASECLPGAATADELCGFEAIPFSNLATTNQERITPPDPKGFLRHAYGEGMKLEASLGTNPFQYGIIAATDTHISAPGLVSEGGFKGHGGAGQANRFMPPPQGFPEPRRPDRGLGGGERTGGDLLGHTPQGDLRYQRPTDRRPHVWRVGLCDRSVQGDRSRRPWLCRWRPHGRDSPPTARFVGAHVRRVCQTGRDGCPPSAHSNRERLARRRGISGERI
jgi:Protein of unknown function (DUF3604)